MNTKYIAGTVIADNIVARAVEFLVKIILLFVVIALLIFLLCECGEPVFRCSKCKSHTKVLHIPRFNGKTTTYVYQYMTTWECKDAETHSREEYEYRIKRKADKR